MPGEFISSGILLLAKPEWSELGSRDMDGQACEDGRRVSGRERVN